MVGAETMSGGTLNDLIKPGSEEQIYQHWANRIAKDESIKLKGRRPPEKGSRELSKNVRKDYIFVDKAAKLRDPMDDNVYYTDLCVNQQDFTGNYWFEEGFHQG